MQKSPPSYPLVPSTQKLMKDYDVYSYFYSPSLSHKFDFVMKRGFKSGTMALVRDSLLCEDLIRKKLDCLIEFLRS